jgi:hypothetical protein
MSEEYVASAFRVEEQAKQETIVKADGNVGRLSTDCTVLHPNRQNPPACTVTHTWLPSFREKSFRMEPTYKVPNFQAALGITQFQSGELNLEGHHCLALGNDSLKHQNRLTKPETRIFFSPQHPDRQWGPPSLLYNGYGGSVCGGKAAGA